MAINESVSTIDTEIIHMTATLIRSSNPEYETTLLYPFSVVGNGKVEL